MINRIKNLIIHCSVSNLGDVPAIRSWHLARGWRDIGYNLVITNGVINSDDDYVYKLDGIIQKGRELDFDAYVSKEEKAAHTLGYNENSIGICLIGKKKFTIDQYLSLYHVCKVFKRINPDIQIKGHYEMSTSKGKTCPNFDVAHFRTIIEGHVFEDEIRNVINENFPMSYND